MTHHLHIQTPLIESPTLSRRTGKKIFLKMENMQPVGSFKIRGIGHLCQNSRNIKGIVSSSGGNAGYAAAYAARKLDMPATVFVPETTSKTLQEKISMQGADVRVVGTVWDEAHEAALKFSHDKNALYVHPFEHPLIWEGHSTIVGEVIAQMGPPDAIVLSVGGGGLLCGVVEGLHRHALCDIPVIAVETEGTASFAASQREGRLVTLDKITGAAKSLGAKTVSAKALEWSRIHPIRSAVVTDHDSLRACTIFADEHRSLVEPACGASISAITVHKELLTDVDKILIIVCGGIGIDLKLMQEWERTIYGGL